MTPCISRFVMTGRILLATLGLCWIAGLADCAEPPGLLFRLSFDKQTVTADFAAGQGHPQSQTTSQDFWFTDGVKGKGLVLRPDQRCVPFWRQEAIACSDPQLRVSVWKKGDQLLLVVANFTDRQRSAELRPTAQGAAVQFRPAWKAETLAPTTDGARLTISAKRGALVLIGPRS